MGVVQERRAMSGATSTTGRATIIRCPACGKANRVRPTAEGTPRCAACKERLPWLVDADAARFDDEVRASVPVVVDLWAPWCGPCRVMAPTLAQLARERAGHLKVVKVNVDENAPIAERFGVQGIPLLVLLRDGTEVSRLHGAAPLPRLNAWLNDHLTTSDHAEGNRS
jgi:thioredoxin 2